MDHRGKNETNESEMSVDGVCDDLLEQEGDRSAPSSKETSLEPDAIAGKVSLTKIQKDRLLQKADFVSERPFFKVVVQPSYANPGHHLVISPKIDYLQAQNLLLFVSESIFFWLSFFLCSLFH